jgi:hypothetical protein
LILSTISFTVREVRTAAASFVDVFEVKIFGACLSTALDGVSLCTRLMDTGGAASVLIHGVAASIDIAGTLPNVSLIRSHLAWVSHWGLGPPLTFCPWHEDQSLV